MDKDFEFFEQNMRREQEEKLDRFRILNQEARKRGNPLHRLVPYGTVSDP